jgi:hypothetical protein
MVVTTGVRTRRNVVVGFHRHVVGELRLVHGFEDGQSLAHGAYSDSFETLCIQETQDITGNVVL